MTKYSNRFYFSPHLLTRITATVFALLPMSALAIDRPGTLFPQTEPRVSTLTEFYGTVCVATQWILVFGLIIGVLFIIYGGVKYITSGGDETKSKEGKKTIITAIIGVVFLLLAVVIVRIVANFIGGSTAGFQLTTCAGLAP